MTLPDRGIRDQHGMEPVSGIFSSPGKEDDGAAAYDGSTSSTSESDMDLANDGASRRRPTPHELTGHAQPADVLTAVSPAMQSESAPDPRDLLSGRRSYGPRSIPRARSPAKTHLKSPAVKKHAGQALRSSPLRGSIVPGGSDNVNEDDEGSSQAVSVSRRLDYGRADVAGRGKNRKVASPATNGSTRANGVRSRADRAANVDDDEDEEAILHGQDDGRAVNGDDSMEMLDGGGHFVEEAHMGDDYDAGPPDADDDEPVVRPSRRRRSGGTSRDVAEDDQGGAADAQLAEESRASQKRLSKQKAAKGSSKRRASGGESSVGEDDNSVQGPRKRQRVTAAAGRSKAREKLPAVAEDEEDEAGPSSRAVSSQGSRKRNRRPEVERVHDEAVGDDSSLKVQQGPPRPRQGGLMIARKEGPNSWVQTRSGRHSVRPVEYWRGERIEYDEEEREDKTVTGKGMKFVVQKMKDVVRVEEIEDKKPSRPRPRATSKKARRRGGDSSDGEASDASVNEADDWEVNGGGVIRQEVFAWRPEHEFEPPSVDDPAEFVEERLALAAHAIRTQDILTANFKYVKTLSLPFFGAGVVDMPPGSEKKPKNSRKMHMVFFVHTGRVKVNINDIEFRIRKGGMWFVPRGAFPLRRII